MQASRGQMHIDLDVALQLDLLQANTRSWRVISDHLESDALPESEKAQLLEDHGKPLPAVVVHAVVSDAHEPPNCVLRGLLSFLVRAELVSIRSWVLCVPDLTGVLGRAPRLAEAVIAEWSVESCHDRAVQSAATEERDKRHRAAEQDVLRTRAELAVRLSAEEDARLRAAQLRRAAQKKKKDGAPCAIM